jgi:hypothetical protein
MLRRGVSWVPVSHASAYGQGTAHSGTITRNNSFPPAGRITSEVAQSVRNIAQASTTANNTAPSCSETITCVDEAGTGAGGPAFSN